jgi:DNA-directed RNA polymerase subunit RPC12/RpoP
MIYCYKCGAQLPDDAQFCYKCGAKVTGSQAQQASASPTQETKSTEAAQILKDMKCPHCGAPFNPKFGEMIITCEYCGSSITLSSEGWKQIQNHTMLTSKTLDNNEVIKIVKEWMDRGIFHKHVGEHSELKEISMNMVPYWIIPASATTNYVASETAESVATSVGTMVAAVALSNAVTRGRGPIMAIGAPVNIRKSFTIHGEYQYPVVALKGYQQYQAFDYQFDLQKRTLFDSSKISKNIKVLNGDLGEEAAKNSAIGYINQIEDKKAHAQHHMIESIKTSVNVSDGELMHVPIWVLKFLYKEKETMVFTVDGNILKVMQETK